MYFHGGCWYVLSGVLRFIAVTVLTLGLAHSHAPSAVRYVSILDDPVINTPSHHANHLSQFDLTFTLHDGKQKIRLQLEPNHDILADDANVQYVDAFGNIQGSEAIDRSEHRVFKGRSWVGTVKGKWIPVGWARIFLKRDGAHPLFEGAFSIMDDDHHVELHSSYLSKRRDDDVEVPRKEADYMVVYRDSDMVQYVHSQMKRSFAGMSTCEADKLSFNADPNHPLFHLEPQPNTSMNKWGVMPFNSLFGLSKRQSDISGQSGNSGDVNLRSTIGDTKGCPTTRKIALIGVYTDCEFTKSFNSTKQKQDAREYVIKIVNSASHVYEKSFNITLGLRDLRVSDADCPSSSPSPKFNMPCSQSNISERLNLFSEWRGDNADCNAYWTLMSNCPTDSEVGLSWLGQLCNSKVDSGGGQSVTGANFVVKTQSEWQVFAHETGHTFGAVHDCDSETCSQGLDKSSQCCPVSSNSCDADGKYIMNPSTSNQAKDFSPCTIGNICSGLSRNSVNSTCLSNNRGITTISPSQCGNGIVEEGEDCDCGGEEECKNNKCCDPKTCKYKNGAVCDDSNESCCSDCQFASADTVCRHSTGPCDNEEKCTGKSGACPKDTHKPDGERCGNSSGLTCASGQCTSRDEQCRSVLGSRLHSNDTYACDDSTCYLQCASSVLSGNTCATVNQNFLDGTPCNGNGHCRNGHCEGGNPVKSWIDHHKPLVIGLAAGIGGPLVLGILWLLVSSLCCCGKRRRPPVAPKPAPVPYGYQPWPPGAPPPMYGPPFPPPQPWFGGPPPPPPPYQGPPPVYR